MLIKMDDIILLVIHNEIHCECNLIMQYSLSLYMNCRYKMPHAFDVRFPLAMVDFPYNRKGITTQLDKNRIKLLVK